jgi:hypothetical protein
MIVQKEEIDTSISFDDSTEDVEYGTEDLDETSRRPDALG